MFGIGPRLNIEDGGWFAYVGRGLGDTYTAAVQPGGRQLCHMVRKPAGRGWRMTVDYRRTNNACTAAEPWPLLAFRG